MSPQFAPDYATARFNMVESQIRPNQVMDQRILDTMSAVPRELFVPASMSGIAYIDEDVPVAAGRYLLEPMVLARMLQEAAITDRDRVLDVGAATGYSTAVIAALAREVIALETDATLAAQAQSTLATLRIRNVAFISGTLTAGAGAQGPFDVIIVNGGMEVVPDTLIGQLAEGGRLLGINRRFGPGPCLASRRGAAVRKAAQSCVTTGFVRRQCPAAAGICSGARFCILSRP